MSLDTKTNLGWHYFRNYFVNDSDTPLNLTKSKQHLESDATEKLFTAKNKDIVETKYNISYFNNFQNKFQLYTTYPGLLVGSGYGHEVSAKGELKLGFFFDYTTGLPIIPGSSIKGVLRSVFPDVEETKGEFPFKLKNDIDKIRVAWLMALVKELDNKKFLTTYFNPIDLGKVSKDDIQQYIKLTYEIFEGVKDITAKKNDDKYYSIYERDIFHDAVLNKAGKNNEIVGTDSITPHIKEGKTYEENMLKNPIPIPFLKVLPGVAFAFNFDLKDSSVLPTLTAKKKLLLFQKILLTIGIGAKTNVGYGQFILGNPTPNQNIQEVQIRTAINLESTTNNASTLNLNIVEKDSANLQPEVNDTNAHNIQSDENPLNVMQIGSPYKAKVIEIVGNMYKFKFCDFPDIIFERNRKKEAKNGITIVKDMNITITFSSIVAPYIYSVCKTN